MDDNDNESINDDDHIHQTISQRRLSSVKIRSLQSINVEDILSTSNAIPHQLRIKEEIIDISSTTPQLAPTLIESITPLLPNIAVPSSPSDNRRASTRQQRRRTFRDSKDSVTSTKKRTRLDTDTNSNFNVESITNSEHIPVSIESQSVEIKKFRTVKRGGKRIVNQQDIEHEEIHSNAQINGTLRQQLEDMFKHRSSRYNFLDLNNNLSGVNRLTHLKDRMRQCQKVFFNLKSALAKIEKQRKIFTRRQKTIIAQPTTTELLLPSSCT